MIWILIYFGIVAIVFFYARDFFKVDNEWDNKTMIIIGFISLLPLINIAIFFILIGTQLDNKGWFDKDAP